MKTSKGNFKTTLPWLPESEDKFKDESFSYEFLGQNLRTLRTFFGRTTTQIGLSLGIKQSSYTDYELGKSKIPLHFLCYLAEKYDVSLNEILFLSKEQLNTRLQEKFKK